jgi:plastocyanin
MTPTKTLALLLGAISGGAVVLACFSDRGAGPATATGECRVPVATIDSMHFIVAIRNFAFRPDSLSVPVGATVTWVNCDDAGLEPHNTTSTTAVWTSPNLSSGDAYSHTFAAGGTFLYSCTIHPSMIAKIVVQ